MRKVHLVKGHAVYVYWIDTVYVQNNLPTEFSKRHGSPRLYILGCGISPTPPESQLAFHIYYVKYENTLTCKRISWDSGARGTDVLKIFFYFLYTEQNF